MADLDELEQAARAATPGPWAFDPLTQDGWAILANFPEPERPYGYGLAVTWSREDAAYIALASPDVILRLIAAVREADALREERAAADALLHWYDTTHGNEFGHDHHCPVPWSENPHTAEPDDRCTCGWSAFQRADEARAALSAIEPSGG